MNNDMQNKFFEDVTRLMTDAAGVAQGATREVKSAVQHRIEQFLNDMDVVPREEFEAIRELVLKSQDRIEALEDKVNALSEKNE